MESRGDPTRECRRINRTWQLIPCGRKRKIRHNGDPMILIMGDQKKFQEEKLVWRKKQ